MEGVATVKYMGRLLDQTDDDWLVIIHNITRNHYLGVITVGLICQWLVCLNTDRKRDETRQREMWIRWTDLEMK